MKNMYTTQNNSSKTLLQRLLISTLYFGFDFLGIIIGNGHWIFFSAISYCVSLIIPASRMVQALNVFFVILIALASGYNLASVILFLIFIPFNIFLFKTTINETIPVFMITITFYVWFYSLITGAGGMWTFSQFIANIVIIYVLLKLTQKRRAIA